MKQCKLFIHVAAQSNSGRSSPMSKRKSAIEPVGAAATRLTSAQQQQKQAVVGSSMTQRSDNLSFLEGSGNADVLTQIYRVAGNRNCADCGKPGGLLPFRLYTSSPFGLLPPSRFVRIISTLPFQDQERSVGLTFDRA